MKLGVSFFTFSPDVSILESIRACAKAGYEGIEPTLNEEGPFSFDSTEKDLLAIKQLAGDLGLEIPSIGAWKLWETPITSADPRVREEAVDTVKRMLDAAAILGADTILVVPGYVGNQSAPGSEVIPYDKAYDNALSCLRILGEHASKVRVNIAIENVWNMFLLSPLEMRGFIDEIGSTWVGSYFDVGNIIYIGYPEQWIHILGERIRKVHVCDFRRGQAGMHGFVDILAGSVDFSKVMSALRAIGYDDYLILEALPNYEQHPYQALYSNKVSLDYVLSL